MSHHTALVDGLARFLASKDLGEYAPEGVFTAGKRGIVVSAFPETPNELIAIAFYMPEYVRLNGRQRRLTASRVQIKTRLTGHPLDTLDMFDRLSQLIDGQPLQLGPIRARGEYLSAAEPSEDGNGRWVQPSNWRLTALEGLPITP